MLSYIDSFLADPKAMLIMFLLAFPGRILAISMHEFAHAWMADRCGDPTARHFGRMTLNPLAHLDPIGTFMMVVMGFGWAKPVPVNPRNFRNLRRDDLKVSVAGVTMNLTLFLVGYVLLAAFIVVALRAVPQGNWLTSQEGTFVTNYLGTPSLVYDNAQYYTSIKTIFQSAIFPEIIAEILIEPAFGRMAGYIYQMLGYFVQVNIVLAVFNLIPIPPLDGYHVLNDLFLKRSLFASQKTTRAASGLLIVLMFTDIFDIALNFVINFLSENIGMGINALVNLIGLL